MSKPKAIHWDRFGGGSPYCGSGALLVTTDICKFTCKNCLYRVASHFWNPIPDPEGCDLFLLEDFILLVKALIFVDYDGSGYFSTSTHVSNLDARPSVLWKGKKPTPAWATHVVWFNK
jgi:hypothetical protein